MVQVSHVHASAPLLWQVQQESALLNIGSSMGLVNRCKHFILASMELAALNQKDLRARARSTPGMTDKKKTADGKWIPKSKQELLAEFELLAEQGSLAGMAA